MSAVQPELVEGYPNYNNFLPPYPQVKTRREIELEEELKMMKFEAKLAERFDKKMES